MSMKKLTFLFLCLLIGIGLATAQTREITGSVISAEDDQPVIGASVIVKGTTTRDGVKIAFNNYLGDGRDQMKNVEKFMEVTDLLRSSETKALFECKYLVAQGLVNGVLGIRDGNLYWYSKSNDFTKYKWSSEQAFVSFLVTEFNTYNPDETVQNFYQDLFNEVKNKGAWVE